MLTAEQVLEEVGQNPDLRKGLISSFKDDFISAPPEGFVVRTKEQDDLYMDSRLNAILPGKVEEKFNERFRTNLEQMDTQITEITGETKGPHEKTTEFLKRAFSTLKSKGGDATTKQRVQELENTLSQKTSEFEQKLSQKDQQLFEQQIDWSLNADLAHQVIAVPPHLKTDAEKQAFAGEQRQLIKSGFKQRFTSKKDDQGNIVFFEGDKALISDRDGKPKTAGELLSETFAAWFVPKGHVLTGTGTTGIVPAGGLRDKESVHTYLAANGLEAGSKEYQDQFEKLIKDNGIKLYFHFRAKRWGLKE